MLIVFGNEHFSSKFTPTYAIAFGIWHHNFDIFCLNFPPLKISLLEMPIAYGNEHLKEEDNLFFSSYFT